LKIELKPCKFDLIFQSIAENPAMGCIGSIDRKMEELSFQENGNRQFAAFFHLISQIS